MLGDGPFRARLTLPWRATYAVGAMIVGWGLAVVLAMAPTPVYSHYAGLATRPWGLSALANQQLAAGVMSVPGLRPLDGDRTRMRIRLARPDRPAPALGAGARGEH